MVDKAVAEESGGLKRLVPTGTSVLIEGTLSETPEGTKQPVELKATKVRAGGLHHEYGSQLEPLAFHEPRFGSVASVGTV